MAVNDPPRALTDDLRFPGHGMPDREADERSGARASRWARLVENQPLGKKINMVYDAELETVQVAPVPFFDFGGSDLDAEQMQIVLDSPRSIVRTFASLAGLHQQNLSGEYANYEIDTADNYPGTVSPIIWPPFCCVLEWGTNFKTRAIVDMVNGAKVNISASAVRAFAIVPPDAFNVPGTSGLYTLGAFATPGWPGPSSASRTIYLGSVAAGEPSNLFVVPPFAKRATIIGMSAANPPAITVATLQFWQCPNGSHNVGNYFVSGNQPGPFDVPNGAAYFSVLSGMGAATAFAVLFELAV
jgi:hypothetical protein